MPPERKAIGRTTPQVREKMASRTSITDERQRTRLEPVQVHTAQFKRTLYADFNLGAFHYDTNYNYDIH